MIIELRLPLDEAEKLYKRVVHEWKHDGRHVKGIEMENDDIGVATVKITVADNDK